MIYPIFRRRDAIIQADQNQVGCWIWPGYWRGWLIYRIFFQTLTLGTWWQNELAGHCEFIGIPFHLVIPSPKLRLRQCPRMFQHLRTEISSLAANSMSKHQPARPSSFQLQIDTRNTKRVALRMALYSKETVEAAIGIAQTGDRSRSLDHLNPWQRTGYTASGHWRIKDLISVLAIWWCQRSINSPVALDEDDEDEWMTEKRTIPRITSLNTP